MPAKAKATWIAVMDASNARCFALRKSETGQVFEEALTLAAEPKPSPSDKPGRFFSAAGGRQTGETLKRGPDGLVRRLADALDTAYAKKQFQALVLVAPARLLAELRQALAPRTATALTQQIAKNLAQLSKEALWEKLSDTLLLAAKPVSSAEPSPAKVAENSADVPVSVVFRNMEGSRTAEAEAAKLTAKLAKKFGRILNCRVTVEAPKHEHKKVREFRVAVAMQLPGRQIATRLADGSAHLELSAAMREAFSCATRQLEGQVKSFKEGLLRQRRKASPRSRGFAEA